MSEALSDQEELLRDALLTAQNDVKAAEAKRDAVDRELDRVQTVYEERIRSLDLVRRITEQMPGVRFEKVLASAGMPVAR